jgi:hypothetical protein
MARVLVQLGHKVQSVFEEAEFYKRVISTFGRHDSGV